MKWSKFFLLSVLVCVVFTVHAKTVDVENAFDFWVGYWDVQWDEGDGKIGKGVNHVHPILDGKAIQENFEVLKGQNKGYKGRSISIFQTAKKEWRQSWSDNQGGYYDFKGIVDNGQRIFQTTFKGKDGVERIARMRFYDIKDDSFAWDWESSSDGGKEWNLLWRIHYTRQSKDKVTSFGHINPDAPAATEQFGQFAGTWDCQVWNLQKDGTWLESQAMWVWNYALNGHAIQDYWHGASGLGTNVRIFNEAKDAWQCAWMENVQTSLNGVWEAKAVDDQTIEMYDDSGSWKITFFNITSQSFDWKWEVDNAEDGSTRTIVKIKASRSS